MPWRLIGFIILCGIFLAFIGFNLGNRCTIAFGFTEIPDVPVYLTAFASFVLGMLCAVPFIVSLLRKKEKARIKGPDAPGPGKKKRGKAKSSEGGASEGNLATGNNVAIGNDGAYGNNIATGNDGSYGID